MYLKIHYKKVRVRLWLPLRAVVGIVCRCARRELKKNGCALTVTRRLNRDIYRALKKTKATFGSFYLVDVKTHDGVEIKIKI